jgi:hypothetical protein
MPSPTSRLEVTQAVLAKTEEAQSIMEDNPARSPLRGPCRTSSRSPEPWRVGAARLEQEELNELCAYGLDLLDRLAFLVRKVEIMDKRETVARMFASSGCGSPAAVPPSITSRAPPTVSA